MTSPQVEPFQLLPPLTSSEYETLRADIAVNGVDYPIIVNGDTGQIIDGHHRDKIARELGVECPRVERLGLTIAQCRDMALRLNLNRRHLTREQKRELVAASLKADPVLSDRVHAGRTGVSPTTVGSIRDELEGARLLSKLDSRTDARGASRTPHVQVPTRNVDLSTGEILGAPESASDGPSETAEAPMPAVPVAAVLGGCGVDDTWNEAHAMAKRALTAMLDQPTSEQAEKLRKLLTWATRKLTQGETK